MLKQLRSTKVTPVVIVLACVGMFFAGCGGSSEKTASGRYVVGDIHNHTWLTDGVHQASDVFSHALGTYNIDFIANSEHGGSFTNSPSGTAWAALNPQPTYLGSPAAGNMWRWQSLRDYSWDIINNARTQYPGKVIIQGEEWNVPTHEHASVGIVNETNGSPIAQFEYLFDQNDTGTTSDTNLNLAAGTKTASTTHQKAIDGIKWLSSNYCANSYVIINHVSRKLKYTIQDLRDLNTAGPDVCFAMEGFPGHQKEPGRGGYGGASAAQMTYGGADIITSEIGGTWDALLSEGRRFWVVVNSDFHSSAANADFYPGQYAKTYTYVSSLTPSNVVAGMRSGNMFIVQGDVINSLDFTASKDNTKTMMGQTLTVAPNSSVTINIKFTTPATNHNNDNVKLNHIDLIEGTVTGAAASNVAGTTSVIKSFTKADWGGNDKSGTITYTINNASATKYYRLRGTNLAINTAGQTDANGNPLSDNNNTSANTEANAWADLWFYSNPLFVKAQ